MRFYSILLLLAPVLLASCNPDPSAGPRVDLVGSSRFLSASRLSTVPADTFTTRVFADNRDGEEADLSRLRITVKYEPTPNPYLYPATGFDPEDITPTEFSLVYLDSVLTGEQQQSIAFQFTAGTRSTSGRETWRFEAQDVDNESNARSYTLRLRNPDSLLTYHRYSLTLPAPTTPGARSYLSLLPGLVLPSFSLRQAPDNQKLIDLVYLTLPNGGRALATPQDPLFVARSNFWRTRRATQLLGTVLDSAAFVSVDTEPELQAAFNAAFTLPNATRTDPLVARGAGRVFAFRTADMPAKTGLVFIQALPTLPTPSIRLQVRITK